MCPRTRHAGQRCAVCNTTVSIGDEPIAAIAHYGPIPDGPVESISDEDFWYEPICSAECVSNHQNGHGSDPVVF